MKKRPALTIPCPWRTIKQRVLSLERARKKSANYLWVVMILKKQCQRFARMFTLCLFAACLSLPFSTPLHAVKPDDGYINPFDSKVLEHRGKMGEISEEERQALMAYTDRKVKALEVLCAPASKKSIDLFLSHLKTYSPGGEIARRGDVIKTLLPQLMGRLQEDLDIWKKRYDYLKDPRPSYDKSMLSCVFYPDGEISRSDLFRERLEFRHDILNKLLLFAQDLNVLRTVRWEVQERLPLVRQNLEDSETAFLGGLDQEKNKIIFLEKTAALAHQKLTYLIPVSGSLQKIASFSRELTEDENIFGPLQRIYQYEIRSYLSDVHFSKRITKGIALDFYWEAIFHGDANNDPNQLDREALMKLYSFDYLKSVEDIHEGALRDVREAMGLIEQHLKAHKSTLKTLQRDQERMIKKARTPKEKGSSPEETRLMLEALEPIDEASESPMKSEGMPGADADVGQVVSHGAGGQTSEAEAEENSPIHHTLEPPLPVSPQEERKMKFSTTHPTEERQPPKRGNSFLNLIKGFTHPKKNSDSDEEGQETEEKERNASPSTSPSTSPQGDRKKNQKSEKKKRSPTLPRPFRKRPSDPKEPR